MTTYVVAVADRGGIIEVIDVVESYSDALDIKSMEEEMSRLSPWEKVVIQKVSY